MDVEKMAVLLLHSYRNIQISILLAVIYIYICFQRTVSSGKIVRAHAHADPS